MNRDDWDRRYAGRELVWSAGPNRFLVEEVGDLAPGRALDLACGEGRNALWLAEQGWRVTAVDFSGVALDKARRLAGGRAAAAAGRVEWIERDLLAYEPPAHAFDLVIVLYLQIPWPEMERVLARAAGAVAPGGTLVVIGHDRRNLTEGHGGPSSAAVLYGPDDVAGALPGLGVERAESVRRPVELEGGETAHAIDVLVRARRHPRDRPAGA